jgi:glycosyltransferase involved in cell wall biosynthesis
MPKIAIVHDNFAQMGGAERVAETIYEMFPGADLFSTLTVQERLSEKLKNAAIRTTWMQHLPAKAKFYRHYFCLYPFAVESMDLTKYDLVISSCFGYAKGINIRADAMHICYCHTPPRWVWRYGDYSAREGFNPVTKLLLPPLLAGLRLWDLKASRKPDYFIANSEVVADRIRKIYHREAVVIPPPIDIERFSVGEKVDDFYLVLSRLVPYKRIDLAITACGKLGRRLIVIGDGPDRGRLESLAGDSVVFLGRQPDSVVVDHLSRCTALLFTGEEDFGMAPLEANASGRPVVAFRGGGAIDTVAAGKTGVFFDEPSASALEAAILQLERSLWDPIVIRQHSESYSRHIFESRFLSVVGSVAKSGEKQRLSKSSCSLTGNTGTAGSSEGTLTRFKWLIASPPGASTLAEYVVRDDSVRSKTNRDYPL